MGSVCCQFISLKPQQNVSVVLSIIVSNALDRPGSEFYSHRLWQITVQKIMVIDGPLALSPTKPKLWVGQPTANLTTDYAGFNNNDLWIVVLSYVMSV